MFGVIGPSGLPYANPTREWGKMGKATRASVTEWLRQYFNPRELIVVDAFETEKARHICPGTKKIVLLDKNVCSVPIMEEGMDSRVDVEVFWCPLCAELIVNKQSLEFN